MLNPSQKKEFPLWAQIPIDPWNPRESAHRHLKALERHSKGLRRHFVLEIRILAPKFEIQTR
jgi:hypothetical protein